MTDKIYLKDLSGMKAVIAKLCDFDHNGIIEKTEKFDEIGIFNRSISQLATDWKPRLELPELKELDVKAEEDKKVKSSIIKAMKLTGKNFSKDDLEYWTDLVKKNSELSGMPPSFIAAIIGRETKFERNISSVNGSGPMQVTGITTKDMFSNKDGGRYNLYEKLDSTLLHEIMYKKDEEGNFIKDSTGNLVKRFSSNKELRDACGKDDELGIQVGLLCFKMKYAKAVQNMKKIGLTQSIEGLKSGTIKLSDKEQEQAVTNALKSYNSVFEEYAPAVVDTIITCGGMEAFRRFSIKHLETD